MSRIPFLAALALALASGACSKDEPPQKGACGGAAACDVREFMKAEIAPELKSGRLEELAQSLDTLAAMAPRDYAEWAALSRQGAQAARSNDADGARKSCGQCHDLYRKRYRADANARTKLATRQETL